MSVGDPPVEEPADPTDQLLNGVTFTHEALQLAAVVHDQAIRDAVAGGVPITEIAAALGVANRKRIYAVLAADPPPARPPLPLPVAYLRGPKASGDRWRTIEAAMHSRGLATTRDRTQAWHRARGGTPVVLVDFSADRAVTVAAVSARWRTTTRTRPVGSLLSRGERSRLAEQGANWLDTAVRAEDREPELPATGRIELPPETDPDEIARCAAAAARSSRSVSGDVTAG